MKWNRFPENRPDEYENVWIYFDGFPYVGFLYENRIHTPDKSFEECYWSKIEPPIKDSIKRETQQ